MRSGQMQGVQTAQLTIHRHRGCMLDEILIHLDDPERRPFLADSPHGGLTGCNGDSTSEEALRRDLTRPGARLGRAREGTATRP
jgi:hypothetical protein